MKFSHVFKANPYHGSDGRFSSKTGAVVVTRSIEVASMVTKAKFYHGTGSDFTAFDLSKSGTGADKGGVSWYGEGVYLSGEEWKGSSYAHAAGPSGMLYSVKAKVTRPLVVEDTDAASLPAALRKAGVPHDLTGSKLTAALKSKGYDSVAVMSKAKGTVNELVVFDPKAAKVVSKSKITTQKD